MQIFVLVLVSILLALILVVLLRIYCFIRPEDLCAGNIVIVTNPHCGEDMMNMMTEVIKVLSPEIVQVRGIRTTVSMHRKWVRRIDVRKGVSIKVPEEPAGDPKHHWGNQARFREIPLRWFSYEVPAKATNATR